MKSEATPGREELALADFKRRCELYLDDAPAHGGHSDFAGSNAYELIQEAVYQFDAIALRLAATSPDPDSMNERCIAEDTRLASNVREATVRECAKVAAGHNGISPRDARDISKRILALADAKPAEWQTLAVTDGMIRAGRAAHQKHGCGAMREIFQAMQHEALSTTGEPKR